MTLLEEIESAFSEREMPLSTTKKNAPATDEYTEAQWFGGKHWKTLSCADFDRLPSAIFGFSPEAFCFYLPGIMTASVRENYPDLMMNQSIINMLDRIAAPSSWDDFFGARWPLLSPTECGAVQQWILWLTEFDPPIFSDGSLSRAYDTIELIALQRRAVPLARAGWSS